MIVEKQVIEHCGRELAANLFLPNRQTDIGVIFAHGYNSNQQGYAEYAEAVVVDQRAAALTFDLSGHGASSLDRDELTIDDHLDDLNAAYDFFRDTCYNVKIIGIVGASYGGYLATMLAVQPLVSVQGLLLRAPALYPDGLHKTPRHEYDTDAINAFRVDLDRSSQPNIENLRAIAAFRGKLAIVASGADESIPMTVPMAYARAARDAKLWIIPEAKHSLVGDERTMFTGLMLDWVAELSSTS
jgi:pimeloyl-ACP methyl ester carboxylesterase